MMDKIEILGLRDGEVKTVASIPCDDASHNTAIMGKDELVISVVTDSPLNLIAGDYALIDGITYRMNRDAELTQKSEVQHEYTLTFEAPIYTLIDKILCNKITGSTTVTLTGKLRDFLELLIWNVNYDADSNPLGIDTGWEIGLCPDTDYMNITLETVKCRDALDTFASKYGLEYYATNKTINYISHIENETGLVFTQGKGGGLYEVEQKNVDDGDLVTRAYIKGGTDNVIPGEGDLQGRLVLPEGYIENFSESSRVVEAEVEFSDIHPTFQGTVGTVSGDNNREFLCPEIDFDIADVAVGDEARVNFLTGDLLGKSFEFKWDNTLKKITLIYQEDDLASIDPDTSARPNIPSASKYLRGGELFNFTGLKLSGSYKANAITKLREKGTDWLAYYCRKRVKFELNVDYRFLRKNNTELHCGDLITINIPLHNISKLIRITDLEKNLHTGKVTCTVSNYLDEKWEKRIEEQISDIQSSTATVNGGYGGASSVTILEKNDEREASDSNVFSALRVLKEIAERALSRKNDDSAAGLITFIKGLVSKKIITAEEGILLGTFVTGTSGAKIDANGDAEVRNLIARIKAKVVDLEVTNTATAKNVTVSDKVTTLNLFVQQLADTYNLNVSNVATLFRTTVKDYVSSETFISGIAGEGFKLYKALSGDWNLEVDNVTIRKAMTIFELIISKIRSVNGGLVVSQGSGRIKSVSETTGTPVYYVLGIEGDMTFKVDDFVRCQVFSTTGAKYYWVRVDSISGNSIVIPKSEFPEGTVPAVGDDIIQMGNKTDKSRQGLLYLTASEDGKPRFSVLDGVNSTNLTGKNKLILGCLDGITDSDFPDDAQPSGYGLWAANVFLKGLFILRNGKSVEDELSDQITAVQTAFEIREGQISTKVQAATAAATQAAGSASAAATSASNAANSVGQASGILVTVTQKETSINQTADAIELKAVRAESAAGRAETAEASINIKADGIVMQAASSAAQAAVDGVHIGGLNLLLNSKGSKSGTSYNVGYWNSSRTFIVGETLTVSIKGNIPGSKLFGIWFNSGSYGGYSLQKVSDGLYSKTITVPGNTSTLTIGIYLIGNQSAGDSWSFEWIKLESGNKATDWTPAPEDVSADATSKANAAQSSAQSYADGKFTTKTDFSAQLTILNNSISSKVAKTDFNALGTRVSNTETTISQHTSQIALKAAQSDLTALGTRVSSAEAKITPSAINLTVKSQTESVAHSISEVSETKSLDLTGLDVNKYYPVTIWVDPYKKYTIEVKRGLWGRDNTASWSTHSAGFALLVKWSTNGSGWGAIAVERIIHAATCRFVNIWPMGNIGQNEMGSEEFFYLRGGSKYDVTVYGNGAANPVLHTSDYTWVSSTYSYNLPVLSSLSSPPERTFQTKGEIQAGISIVAGGISIFGQAISFSGMVTFSSLASDAQSKINAAQSTANTAVSNASIAQSTANTANSTANSALSIANTANGGLSTLKNSLGAMAYQNAVSLAKLDSSILDGGYFKTSLIDANAVVTGSLLASKIAATDITTNKLTVANNCKIGDFTIYNGIIKSTQSMTDINAVRVELGIKGLSTGRVNGGVQGVNIGDFTSVIDGVTTPTGLIISALGGCAINATGNVKIDGDIKMSSGSISGFATKTRRASGTINLDSTDCFISCTGTSTVNLPTYPVTGKEYFICRRAHVAVTIYSRSGPSMCRSGTSIFSSMSINNDGEIWWFKYDGQYWVISRLDT